MKTLPSVGLRDVQAVYGGPEGALWELVMGQQIHIGGFQSSMDLAGRAGIQGGRGVDLCCCNGAGMRFLARFRDAQRMTGVDATPHVVELGRQRCRAEGFAPEQIDFVLADVCQTGLPAGQADFVWGEDAWCYVADKPALIREAARLLKPGGTIAFTDWVEGPGLSAAEAERFLRFMKFPSLFACGDYARELEQAGCKVVEAQDTGRFAPHVDLYLNMLNMQLTYDALRIIGFDVKLMAAMAGEMAFMQALAHAGKIQQGRFIAHKARSGG